MDKNGWTDVQQWTNGMTDVQQRTHVWMTNAENWTDVFLSIMRLRSRLSRLHGNKLTRLFFLSVSVLSDCHTLTTLHRLHGTLASVKVHMIIS